MYMERQTTHGWLIATDQFLVGMGGGIFLLSFILNVIHRYESISRIGALVGPLLVLVGAFLLTADITRRTRVYRLFSNFTSWTCRGTWIMTAFVIVGLAYSLPFFDPLAWLPWKNSTTLWLTTGWVAALLSVLVVLYPGFLFANIKSIPFWNTPALPLLFLLSGLCAGTALLLLIIPFFASALGQNMIATLHMFGVAGIALVLLLLITLWGYLDVASHANVASMESAHLLKSPRFFIVVVISGLVVPLALLSYAVFFDEASVLSALSTIASILLLMGGLYLRYSILRVGIYLPRFSI